MKYYGVMKSIEIGFVKENYHGSVELPVDSLQQSALSSIVNTISNLLLYLNRIFSVYKELFSRK